MIYLEDPADRECSPVSQSCDLPTLLTRMNHQAVASKKQHLCYGPLAVERFAVATMVNDWFMVMSVGCYM